MQTDEFIVELKLCTDTARAAEEAFAQGKFEEASNLYFLALKEANELFGPNTLEVANCLQGLADAYYAQDKFIESKSVYQQLIPVLDGLGADLVQPHQRIAALYKLAKSHEKLQESTEADQAFTASLRLAEEILPPGHTQRTTILEAFANMLRKARRDPKRLAELEERARANRRKYSDPGNLTSNILEQVDDTAAERLEKKHVWEPKKAKKRNQLFPALSDETSWLLGAARRHPRVATSCLCAPLLLALLLLALTLFVSIQELQAGIALPEGQPGAPGSAYVSPRGDAKITFLDHGNAKIDRAGTAKKYRCFLAKPGWTEFLNIYFLHKQTNNLWLVRRADELKDPQNNIWLLSTSKASVLKEELPIVADACSKTFLSKYDYPSILDLTTSLRQAPPSGRIITPVLRQEERLNANSMKRMESGESNVDSVFNKITDPLKPTTLYCFYNSRRNVEQNFAGGMVLFVTDTQGASITETVRFILPSGVIGRLSTRESADTTALDRSFDAIVVSSSSPDMIRRIYGSVIWLALLLVGLGAGLLALLNVRSVVGDYTSVQAAQHHFQHWLWMGWSVGVLCAIAWAGVILFNIFVR